MTSVLLVDDHPFVASACWHILQHLGVDRVHEATNIKDAYRAYLHQRFDVVISDLTFPDDDLGGLRLVQRILSRDRHARVLVFSMHDSPAIITRVIESGALSYVTKDASPLELAEAFEKVAAGRPHLSDKMAMQVATLRLGLREKTQTQTTGRERRVLDLLRQGKRYEEIADTLGVSYKTIVNTCSALRTKFKLGSLAELIRFAIDTQDHRQDL